jgi:hypothetical protein
MMKYGVHLASMLAAIALHLPAQADARLDGMKKMNSDGCVKAIEFEEHAPKNASQVKPYCTCVYETYFDGFTKAEQSQLMSGGPAPEKLQKSLPGHLEAAQASCRKKIGF